MHNLASRRSSSKTCCAAARRIRARGVPGSPAIKCCGLALARQWNDWSYEELAFHLADSASYRTFCRVSALGVAPSKSAVAANLRALRPRTLAALNDCLITSAAARAIERGRTVRIDSTVVPVAIHAPAIRDIPTGAMSSPGPWP